VQHVQEQRLDGELLVYKTVTQVSCKDYMTLLLLIAVSNDIERLCIRIHTVML
jgi:hypothetical protein